MKLKFDWFLWALLGAVGLAIVLPGPGGRDGVLHPQLTNKIGVAVIFFLHGVGLSFQALKAGTLHWRLHLLVQSCTFVLFPLLGAAIYFLGRGWLGPDLALGVFFLCALPSTVSSSVAITAAAKGNVPAALFNATISSVLGVVLTPLWVGWVSTAAAGTPGLGEVIVDLARWLLLPLIAGQALRPVFSGWASRNKSRIHLVDRASILFLVYTSFADSVLQGVWSQHSVGTLLAVAVLGLLLFTGVMLISGTLARALGFAWEDQIAVMFCGSKKSMATGVPMAQVMFAASPALGLLILPLLLYHTLQLVLAGTLAARWGRR